MRILPLRLSGRPLRSIATAALAVLTLTGCATLRGAQDAPTSFTPPAELIGYDEALLNYGQPDDEPRSHMSRAEYRDYILDLYMIDIENRYRLFKQALTAADRESALTGDLALLALSGATALAGKSSIDELATLTAVAAGARTAVDKRLFFDRTMPAVIAAMDAKRAAIKAEIAVRRRLPPAQYSLGEAIADLTRLTDAGNIFAGVDRITADATASKEAAEERLKTIVEGCAEADANTTRLNDKFRRLVNINDPRRQGRLEEAAKLLGLPQDGRQLGYGDVASAFDDKFCGDVGKPAFIDQLERNIMTREGN